MAPSIPRNPSSTSLRNYSAARQERYLQLLVCFAVVIIIYTAVFWPLNESTDRPLHFISLGDFGIGSANQYEVANQMAKYAERYHPKFVLSLGDNFYPSGVKDVDDPLFTKFFENVYARHSMQLPWYMTLGDHDHCGNVAAQIAYSRRSARWRMPARYYSLNLSLKGRGSMELVVVDSVCLEGIFSLDFKARRFGELYNMTVVGKKAGLKHMSWLKSTLSNSTADWLVVVAHRPVQSCGTRARFPIENAVSNKLRPLLQKYHVDLYLNGHDHLGQHLEHAGVTYIGNGVGGYGVHAAKATNDTIWFNNKYSGFVMHSVTEKELVSKFVSSDGKVLHTVRLTQAAKRARILGQMR